MSEYNTRRTPGVATVREFAYRTVFLGEAKFYEGGLIVDGSLSRDPGQGSPDTDKLRAGMLMGRVTASNKYAPSVIDVSTVAYTSGGTELTISVQGAIYLVSRVGSSGTFSLVGPPTAGGTVATATVTYSAVDVGTGVITVADIGANYVAGSLVMPEDGSEVPKYVRWNGTPLKVTDIDALDIDVEEDKPAIGGTVKSDALIPWPSDTSLQTYIRDLLNGVAGTFIFDDEYE